MRDGNFAGRGINVAAEQTRVAGGVVRRAERTAGDERLPGLQQADDAVNLRRLQCLGQCERRQNGGESFGEHGFAGARWADQQHVIVDFPCMVFYDVCVSNANLKTPVTGETIRHKRRGYSYVRFSTPEQRLGDSLRRQLKKSHDYCLKHDIILDKKLKLYDDGISAYEGRNTTEGDLAEFLRLARRGDIPPNSLLLVENLDRLSRQTPRKALRTLESIIECGIDVVTLTDEKIHTAESLDDFITLLSSLVIMFRAHDESKRKAQMLADSWEEKRRSGNPLGKICPGWLRLEKKHKKDPGIYVPIPERVSLVKRIFKMALSGHGKRTIAGQFNKEEIQPWGVGGKRGVGWHDSYIQKILHNDAVIGIFHPHRVKNKKRTDLKTPIAGYYPAIISELEYRRVQALAKRATPGRVEKVSNLFTGVCFDGYNPEFTMRFVDKGTKKRGNGKWRYLVSDALRLKPSANAAKVRYADFEYEFLNHPEIDHCNLHEIYKDDPQVVNAAIELLQAEINEKNATISLQNAAIERGDPPEALLARMREVEAERKKLMVRLQEWLDKQAEAESIDELFEKEWKRFDELVEAKTLEARLALRQYIRRTVKRIELFPQGIGERANEWEYGEQANGSAFSVEYANGAKLLFFRDGDNRMLFHPKGWTEANKAKSPKELNYPPI